MELSLSSQLHSKLFSLISSPLELSKSSTPLFKITILLPLIRLFPKSTQYTSHSHNSKTLRNTKVLNDLSHHQTKKQWTLGLFLCNPLLYSTFQLLEPHFSPIEIRLITQKLHFFNTICEKFEDTPEKKKA